jgi:hypothetical protein
MKTTYENLLGKIDNLTELKNKIDGNGHDPNLEAQFRLTARDVVTARAEHLAAVRKAGETPTQTHCASCGVLFVVNDLTPHSDSYHADTMLCGECYADPVRAKATASNPDDPTSWWNKPAPTNGRARSAT